LITPPHHQTFLLDGVTGSGKTEVYFALIRHAIAPRETNARPHPRNRPSNPVRTTFYKSISWTHGQLFHGQLTPKQRIERWHAIQSQHVDIIISPRSALFTPSTALGLIIVDEEHDGSYKNEFAPYYHARDCAIMYAKLINIPIVLGSATPSIELLYAATQQRITKLALPERIDISRDIIALPDPHRRYAERVKHRSLRTHRHHASPTNQHLHTTKSPSALAPQSPWYQRITPLPQLRTGRSMHTL
jgi:primosomal protein N' (replication factor Y)